jgi:hypothetical protein
MPTNPTLQQARQCRTLRMTGWAVFLSSPDHQPKTSNAKVTWTMVVKIFLKKSKNLIEKGKRPLANFGCKATARVAHRQFGGTAIYLQNKSMSYIKYSKNENTLLARMYCRLVVHTKLFLFHLPVVRWNISLKKFRTISFDDRNSIVEREVSSWSRKIWGSDWCEPSRTARNMGGR